VSAWGGYVFIINLIPLHVLTLMLMGRCDLKVYIAYTSFIGLGFLMSMQVRLAICHSLRFHCDVGPLRGLSPRADERAHGRHWCLWPHPALHILQVLPRFPPQEQYVLPLIFLI
jgi:hypothetical protein